MIQLFLVFSDWGILVLRVVLGLILIFHGFPKIRDLKGTASGFGAMGFRPGLLWATAVAVLEFGGGILLLAGLLTQVVAALLFIQFLVIILKLKIKSGLVGGFEFELLILASALALATLGSGSLSLDHFLGLYLY
jgi:putative oxidoreductase